MRSPLPPRVGLTLALLVSASLASVASAQNLDPLRDFSVVLSGNLSTSSDIEGRTIVGGNLISSNSANFGIKLQGKVSSSDLVLRVKGNILGGNSLQLNAGSLELGGSLNGRRINYNGGGSLVSNPSADYSSMIRDLTLASEMLATYGANSNVVMPASQPAPFRLEASPDATGLATFSINASDLFGNNKVQQIELISNRAVDIVINVAGKHIKWVAGNMVGDLTKEYWRQRVVWNFYEAETLALGSHNMMGQILAPNATVTSSNNIDGSIFAKNLTTTGEVHLPGYQGGLEMIPEPSSAAMGVLGLGLLVFRRKR